MTKTPTAPLDAARVTSIADAIRAACSPITGVDLDKSDAQAAAKSANDTAVNTREGIFVALADLAHRGQWTNAEISGAAVQALTGTGANSDKAIATFVGEAKSAMDEAVRVYVPMFVTVRNEALLEDAAAKQIDKDARLPCKLAWSRQYHMLMAMFGAAKKGRVIRDTAELTAYAEIVLEERAGDAGKAFAEKNKLVDQIRALYARFPDDDFQVAAETLERITKTHMETARQRDQATTTDINEKRMAAIPLAPVPASVAARFGGAQVTTTVVADNSEVPTTDVDVAEGAVDILDDILGGNSEVKLAA